ncbi:hypothetical protein N7462_001282 [Penicillium macrosclerotiorum]|uniref:uncharacterized protein n=1 Tax=Penicillium macrosclerotiorum TaxID=303699 RepID=UPI002546FB49|nr:uncharacterized protein N7462_001282 [Penicillium macrosclerotiorum]KAJ5691859.1 hypothetical protein N7462_001282 [Penicillium macrosclerotiorum]
MRAISEKIEKLKSDYGSMTNKIEKLEAHRQSHLDIRQRAISKWVRDALNKDTERRKQEISRIDKDIIYGGDVRSDAMVVTERYKKSSTEWGSFHTLYGLSPDNMNSLDQQKCYRSLQVLDRAASILLRNAWTSFPHKTMEKKRDDLVTMLLEERYEEAEKMSSIFFCGDESVAEEDFYSLPKDRYYVLFIRSIAF